MTPVIQPLFTTLKIDDAYVVAVEIPSVDVEERPCYYSGVGRSKGSYVRSGDSDEPMTDYEVYSYEAFRKKYQDGICLTERADLSMIDMRQLESYLEQITGKNPNLTRLPKKDIQRFLNMVIDGVLTLICTLLFSIYPQYTINATVVPGYERGRWTRKGLVLLTTADWKAPFQNLLMAR